MKKFLIIQLRPEDETADSEYACFLRHGGLRRSEVVRVRLEKAPLAINDLSSFCAIIVGGSPFDISMPEEEKSLVQKRIEDDFKKLFDIVVPEDRPFLGACSGSGLLGQYLSTSISGRYAEPVGGVDITVTRQGMTDPLLTGLPQTFRALVGHKEACDTTPDGAVLLASSKTCPVQMYRVGAHVYATQFHPEADAAEFIVRVHAYKNHGYFPASTAQKLIATIAKEHVPVPQRILRRFVTRYRNT